MKNLWIFSKATDEKKQHFLSRMVEKDDAIIFIQDGTYLLLRDDFKPVCPVYALKPDLVARGIKASVKEITYADFVDLIFQYRRTITV
jgi:sulfur relay protein TusB/DsrH